MRRGDVHAATLRAPRGAREQRGRRYAVVVQSDAFEQLTTVVIAPTSTSAQPAIFRPDVEIGGKRTRLLPEQMRAVDRARLGRRVARLSWSELQAVDDALKLVLGLL
jgi:mRNA interferase MazF